MLIRLLLFARARELVGRDSMELELREGSRIADLQSRIVEVCPALAGLMGHSAWAIDENIVGTEGKLRDGAEVALLPPVSGG
jgi:molybdopterin synthase catalytic subunit